MTTQIPYSTAFNVAITFVLESEGGYVHDPDDAGGETNFGISKRAYPHLEIKSLTKAQAVEIYYQDYWLACRCHQLPAYMAAALFDTAVNMGNRTAAKLLQQALRVSADGIIGSQTLNAAQQQSAAHFLPQFFSYRGKRYSEIAQQGQNIKFIRGWLKRCFDLYQHLHDARLI